MDLFNRSSALRHSIKHAADVLAKILRRIKLLSRTRMKTHVCINSYTGTRMRAHTHGGTCVSTHMKTRTRKEMVFTWPG